MSRSDVAPAFPSSPAHLGWHALRQHHALAAAFVTAGLTHAASHGAVAWIAGNLGRTIVGAPVDGKGFAGGSPTLLASMGLAAVLIKGGAGILATLAQTRLSGAAGQHLRDLTLHRLLHHGATAPAPTVVARFVSRIREAESAVHQGAFATTRALAQLLPIVVALWFLAPSLTAVALLVLAPFALLLARARKRWRSAHHASMQAADTLHEETDDIIRHADLWRSYGTGARARQTVARLGNAMIHARVRSETTASALSATNEVLAALALLLALAAAAHWPGSLDGGRFVAFATVFFMAYRPLRDLGDARASWTRGQEALASLAALTPPLPRPAPTPAPRLSPTDALAATTPACLDIRGLHVPGRSPTLTCRLVPGRMIALCGPTGVGKTTLLRALLGLDPAAQGEVRFRHQVLPPGQVGPTWRPFAWVPQDAPVVSGTLEDNFALTGALSAHALAELDALGAGELRAQLAHTRLGQGGRPLSGGERRWIALARALASGHPVLLLDEPTVGLDPDARARVLALLKAARASRALLVVTHAEEVIALADEVVRVGEPGSVRVRDASAPPGTTETPDAA